LRKQSATAESAVCLIFISCVLLGFLVMGGGLGATSLGGYNILGKAAVML